MERFVVRAAQSAFHQAGYSRQEALRQAQQVASSMLTNLSACQIAYGINDELELAYQMARQMIAYSRGGAIN